VIDARDGRPEELRSELGDLLFQIIFYAQVAHERGDFSIEDVTDAIHTKMVRRHPHVFGNEEVRDTAEVLRNWEAIKAEEKRVAGKGKADENASLLDGVSANAPALMEAHQLSTKAARVGFDWKLIEDIFDKLHEELDELREAMREDAESKEADKGRVREELGDVLFAVVNIARHLRVEPEAALKVTNRKFRKRFRHVEQGLRRRGRSPEAATLDEMEDLWQEAKKQ
jgi:MazG family protein